MSSDRFARQRILAEVGECGQKSLAEASVQLPCRPEADVAAEYLRRAGVGTVSKHESDSDDEPAFPHAALFRHASSAMLAQGVWRALHEIRALLQPSAKRP